MENNLQKILKSYKDQFSLAKKYYFVLFGLNDIKITNTELDLISYIATHGTISSTITRDKFIHEFNVPEGSVYNMTYRLKKKNILVKDDHKKIQINPIILSDFSKDNLILAIKLSLNGN